MKIESIKIAGIRGFNEERSIDLHSGLTVISAPNSCGKTSISESLEWLFYGTTSKMRQPASVEEYKGSLRNVHYSGDCSPSVEVILAHDGERHTASAVLQDGDSVARYVDGDLVTEWPFCRDLDVRPRPFVLQHALKNLLLTAPKNRFLQFTELLGLQDLSDFKEAVTKLCTKPEVAMPLEAIQVQEKADDLLSRMKAQPSFTAVVRALNKGPKAIPEVTDLIRRIAAERVGAGPDETVLSLVLAKRNEAVAKIFSGSVALDPYIEEALEAQRADMAYIVGFCSKERCSTFATLGGIETARKIAELASFFATGENLLAQKPESCPLCGQPADDSIRSHVHECKQNAEQNQKSVQELTDAYNRQVLDLQELTRRINGASQRGLGQSAKLLEVESLEKIKPLLGESQGAFLETLKEAQEALGTSARQIQARNDVAVKTISTLAQRLRTETPEASWLEVAAKDLFALSQAISNHDTAVSSLAAPLAGIQALVRDEVDKLAGTEELTLIADSLRNIPSLRKALEIKAILEGVKKELRQCMDQFVAKRMLVAINSSLSVEVMKWYGMIRTTGDPDVHFSGIDLERKADGSLKNQIAVQAQSYGRDLVSAVSCLSESKLNALGLCLSVAANTIGDCPFEFILIDDPIQSLDSEHEAQFVAVISSLVEGGKQVILLSHNDAWLKQVRAGCRSLNGRFYRITGYDIKGPHISEGRWCTTEQRFDEADAILKDVNASDIRLGQAEEEMRHMICEIAADVYQRSTGMAKNPSELNSKECRKILISAGIDATMVDGIMQAFLVTDQAHHAAAPDRNRIASLLGRVRSLHKLNNTRPKS